MRPALRCAILALSVVGSEGMAPPVRATPTPALVKGQPGLKVAAGAALGNILQGFNTGIIAGALLFIVPEVCSGAARFAATSPRFTCTVVLCTCAV